MFVPSNGNVNGSVGSADPVDRKKKLKELKRRVNYKDFIYVLEHVFRVNELKQVARVAKIPLSLRKQELISQLKKHSKKLLDQGDYTELSLFLKVASSVSLKYGKTPLYRFSESNIIPVQNEPEPQVINPVPSQTSPTRNTVEPPQKRIRTQPPPSEVYHFSPMAHPPTPTPLHISSLINNSQPYTPTPGIPVGMEASLHPFMEVPLHSSLPNISPSMQVQPNHQLIPSINHLNQYHITPPNQLRTFQFPALDQNQPLPYQNNNFITRMNNLNFNSCLIPAPNVNPAKPEELDLYSCSDPFYIPIKTEPICSFMVNPLETDRTECYLHFDVASDLPVVLRCFQLRVNNTPLSTSSPHCSFKCNGIRLTLKEGLVDIKPFCRNGKNIVSYNYFKTPPLTDYYCVIQYMHKQSVEHLLSGINEIDYECGKVIAISSFDTHVDIVETAHIVSMLDIYGRSVIKYPCRSALCVHINVFDVKIWLSFNEKEKKWSCPICSKILSLHDLYIDGFFKKIFEGLSDGVTEICVFPNGEWSPAKTKEKKTKKKKIVIDLTGPDDEPLKCNWDFLKIKTEPKTHT